MLLLLAPPPFSKPHSRSTDRPSHARSRWSGRSGPCPSPTTLGKKSSRASTRASTTSSPPPLLPRPAPPALLPVMPRRKRSPPPRPRRRRCCTRTPTGGSSSSVFCKWVQCYWPAGYTSQPLSQSHHQSSSHTITPPPPQPPKNPNRNHRPTWNASVDEPVAGNYYPVNAAVFLHDATAHLAVVVDRSQVGGWGCVGHIMIYNNRNDVIV